MDTIHKHYEVEELKLTIQVLLCSLGPSSYYYTTIDCLKELIESIDSDDEYVYNLPLPVPVNALYAGDFRKLLDLDHGSVLTHDLDGTHCSEGLGTDFLENILERGLVTRVDVEHPGGTVCLQTGFKNVFYADDSFDDLEGYISISDGGKIKGYEGPGSLAESFLDETLLCFPESRKVRRLLDGLGVATRNIHLICFPRLQCHGNKIVIVAFCFMSTIGDCESFNERTDETTSFHHVLEEALGVVNRCGGCGKMLPMDAKYCSHCATKTKKRKLEDTDEE